MAYCTWSQWIIKHLKLHVSVVCSSSSLTTFLVEIKQAGKEAGRTKVFQTSVSQS